MCKCQGSFGFVLGRKANSGFANKVAAVAIEEEVKKCRRDTFI
jgi:hypothetical protein